jgi:alkylation response protein AidB-like acyl-CoA dehydrogenase
MIVMEAFGRGLVVEPFLPTAVVATALLVRGADELIRRSLLPAISAGELKVAVATHEPGAGFDLSQINTHARCNNERWSITGRKCVVLAGDSADKLIVPARTAGAPTGQFGISLFLVNARSPGMSIRSFPTIDGLRCAEVELSDVVAEALLGQRDEGYPLLEWAVDRGIAALCAEAVGVMESTLQMTADYLKSRVQFGQTLSRFQALQHSVADMFIALQQARAVALLAAAEVDNPERDQRRRAIATAKAIIGRTGRLVGEQSIQLHGGMGMTDEMPVGLYFKRLRCIDMTWGDSDHQLDQYGELMLPT